MRTRRGVLVTLLMVAFVVNLPFAHSTLQQARLAADGVDVRAEVTDHEVLGGEGDARHLLVLRFPDDAVETEPALYQVLVEPQAYDEAVAAGDVAARVLPASPQVFEVDGMTSSRFIWWTTLGADLLLVLVGVLAWRYAGRRETEPAQPHDGPDDWPFSRPREDRDP